MSRMSSSARDHVVDSLRSEIISGERAPGSRLIERVLTDTYGVSRNTLREAFRQLEAEGFLDIRPHRGGVVTELDIHRASGLYELRESIECMAVELFTRRASDGEVAQLTQAFERFAAAVGVREPVAVVADKDAFYDLLYEGARNRELYAQARMLYGRLAALRTRSLSDPGRAEVSRGEIEEVLAAIARRDVVTAVDLWRSHIRNAAAAAVRALRGPVDAVVA